MHTRICSSEIDIDIENIYGDQRKSMAVEARHLNLFPPQILSNRDLVMNGVEANGHVFGTPAGYGVAPPLSGTSAATETVFPMYGSAAMDTFNFPAKNAAMKSDSGLTYVPVSRKRSRDPINCLFSPVAGGVQNQSGDNRCGSVTFLGEDISFQIQQQQLEIDRYIALHTEKVRTEIEERRKRYTRRIAAAVEENVMKRLKSKEEEIEKIGKFNFQLEEKLKSLAMENQIWRDLAQTNEATANALRCNLEQVLTRIQNDEQRRRPDEAAEDLTDDAQSCCGSNNSDEIERLTLADSASTEGGCIAPRSGMCRRCEKEESCVLLLPCRHLCLCTFCGSSIHTCPVCHSAKTASVHVNLSSS